jgi:hypothetical protein
VTDTVGPALQALLALAERMLADEDRAVNMSVLAPGNNVVWDDCCPGEDDPDEVSGRRGGQLWVRVVSQVARPSDSQTCGVTTVQVRAAIGVVRCMHCLDSEGNPPDPEQMEGDTLKTTQDSDTMLFAIEDWRGEEWVVEGWRQPGQRFVNWKSLRVETGTPLGPQGCCGGFEWAFTFDVTRARAAAAP